MGSKSPSKDKPKKSPKSPKKGTKSPDKNTIESKASKASSSKKKSIKALAPPIDAIGNNSATNDEHFEHTFRAEDQYD